MRAAIRLLVLVSLLSLVAVAGAGAQNRAKPVLTGDGVGAVHFGAGQTAALRGLRQVVGAPPKRTTFSNTPGCGFTAWATWGRRDTLTVFFDRRRFVGYSYWGTTLATTTGLTVGDRLARVQKLYPHTEVSAVQGGAWFARTPVGPLSGFLRSVPRTTDPRFGVLPAKNHILSIGAGRQGCPAMSP